MMKKILLILFFIVFLLGKTFAFDTLEYYKDFDAITPGSTHTDIIPTGEDFYLDYFCIIDTGNNAQDVEVELYDDSLEVLTKDFAENECFEADMIFKDSVKWTNNGAQTVTHFTSGFYFNEGQYINFNGEVYTKDSSLTGSTVGTGAILMFQEIDGKFYFDLEQFDRKYIDYLLLLVFIVALRKITLGTSYYFRKK